MKKAVVEIVMVGGGAGGQCAKSRPPCEKRFLLSFSSTGRCAFGEGSGRRRRVRLADVFGSVPWQIIEESGKSEDRGLEDGERTRYDAWGISGH